MRLLVFLLCSPALAAVTLLKVAAGPGGAGWVPDASYVSGGATQAVAGAQTPPYNYLRYAPANISVRYSFPLLSTANSITLFFIEPRIGSTIGLGQRVFSVSLNGLPILTNLDLFNMFGPLLGGSYTFPIPAFSGPLSLEIRSSAGNSVISAIQVDGPDPLPPPPPPASGLSLSCKTGTVPYSALTSTTNSQDLVIIANVPDTYRIHHVMVRVTVPFAGTGLGVRMEPGLTSLVDLMTPGATPWIERPGWPVGTGPYDILLRFSAAAPIAGSLTAGTMAWEVCGFDALTAVAVDYVCGKGCTCARGCSWVELPPVIIIDPFPGWSDCPVTVCTNRRPG